MSAQGEPVTYDVTSWLAQWNASDIVRLGYALPRHRHERQEKLIADLAVMLAVTVDGYGWTGFEAELLAAARELRRMRAEAGNFREFGTQELETAEPNPSTTTATSHDSEER